MSYNFTLPVTTEGTEENPFQYTKDVIKRVLQDAVSKMTWKQQEDGISLLSKIEQTTETDNILSLTEGEKEVLSRIASKFIGSKGSEFVVKVPELHYLIKELRDDMDFYSLIQHYIEKLDENKKNKLKNWLEG